MPMRRALRIATIVIALTWQVGCGYFMAGRWQDDPKNWARVFHSEKPPDVVVVHSEYWRSPHWSYEMEYFFEIAPNAALHSQLFSKNGLRRLVGSDASNVKGDVFGAVPSWFAPKSPEDYEVWVYSDDSAGHFKVLID